MRSLSLGLKQQKLDYSLRHKTSLLAVAGPWSDVYGDVAIGTGNLVCSLGHRRESALSSRGSSLLGITLLTARS